MTALANHLSNWILLLFVVGIPFYGAYKKINIFDVFVGGARDGLTTSINILPYLIAMIVAVGMLKASGFFELLGLMLAPFLEAIGMPTELLPLALMRPFSGSASTAIMSSIIQENGGNSLIAKTAATMMGSTETTFYVIAIYFGSIGIKRTRHAIPAGLLADLAGITASVFICQLLFS